MDVEDDNSKKNRGRSRGTNRTRGRGRGKTRGRTKKAVKVIESDDDDVSQHGDENAMDTGPEAESQEEAPQNSQSSQQLPSNSHVQQVQPALANTQAQQIHPPVAADHPHQNQPQHIHQHQHQQQFDLEADISQLEAPTFTTINRGPPEPMLRLRWDHRVNLIGEKVLNPMIHCCDKCLKPILIYGRMIPCKHVFCLLCAKREDKICPRCMEKVNRVEQTGLGTVFMCTHGGTRYGNAGCRRTYLSQRDLQAHINHRHVAAPPSQAVQSMQLDGQHTPAYMQHAKNSEMLIETQLKGGPNNRIKSMGASHLVPIMGNDPRVNSVQQDHRQPPSHRHFSQNSVSSQQQSSNAQMRSNLITVNIQDTSMGSAHEISQQQGHHYYHSTDNHVNANLSARHVVLSNQAPPQAPPQVNYASYNVGPVPSAQAPYYGAQQHAPHPSQIGYVPTAQQQAQSYGPRSSGYVQDGSQYAVQQPQSVVPPPQSQQQQQWSQHPQQFYR